MDILEELSTMRDELNELKNGGGSNCGCKSLLPMVIGHFFVIFGRLY